MPWGRVDDTHYDHPKVMDLPREIRNQCDGLYWRCISWSNAKLTDGYVPLDQVRRLDGRQSDIAALIDVGMFEPTEGGIRVHDFLDFNDSREKVLADRAAARDRMRNRRSSNDVRENFAAGSETPSRPSPVPSRPFSDSPPTPPRPGPLPSALSEIEEKRRRVEAEPYRSLDEIVPDLAKQWGKP